MITDWTSFEEMCKAAKTDGEIIAVVKYLTDNGYDELSAREMVQFRMATLDGKTPAP